MYITNQEIQLILGLVLVVLAQVMTSQTNMVGQDKLKNSIKWFALKELKNAVDIEKFLPN